MMMVMTMDNDDCDDNGDDDDVGDINGDDDDVGNDSSDDDVGDDVGDDNSDAGFEFWKLQVSYKSHSGKCLGVLWCVVSGLHNRA